MIPPVSELSQVKEALARSQELLQAILANSPDRIYLKDTQSRFLLCSRSLVRRLGVESEEQVIGHTDFDFQMRERAEEFFRDEQRIFQTGEPLINKVEKQIMADGSTVWTSTTKVPLRDAEGKITGLVGINRDITEHVRAEAALREFQAELERHVEERTTELLSKNAELAHANESTAKAQRLLQALLDYIPDWIYFKDTESRFLLCSKSHAKRLRVADPALVVGKTDFDFHPREKAEEFYRDEQRIIQTGEPLINKLEEKLTVDGKKFWVSTTKIPLRDNTGRIVGVAGVNRDVTERVLAEEAARSMRNELELRVAEQARAERELARGNLMLRTLIDHLPDALLAKDTAGRIFLVNPAGLNYLQRQTEGDVLGKTVSDFVPPELAQSLAEDDRRVIKGEAIHNREEHFLDQAGELRWVLTSKLPLRDQAGGSPSGLISISRDITGIKQSEQKLESLHRELIATSRRAGMAEVATGVLHNVGNVLNSANVGISLVANQASKLPVHGVARLAQLLREQAATLGAAWTEDASVSKVLAYVDALGAALVKEQAKLLLEVDGLKKNIQHINAIVAAQQEHACALSVAETIELPELIEDAIRLNGPAFARQDIIVDRKFALLPPVTIDKHQVLQILVNLFSNAAHACAGVEYRQGKVAVHLEDGGHGYAKISVQDNGMGIAPENIGKLFFQGFSTRKGGHGFGLHTSALMAKALGGALTARSDGVGCGATFILQLPYVSSLQPKSSTKAAPLESKV